MASSSDLIAVAAEDVGYSRWNDPQSGTKFGRWYAQKVGNSYYAGNGIPFCAMGVSYWLDRAGISCAGFPTAGCGSAMNAAIALGAWHKGNEGVNPPNRRPEGIQAGAVIIFNWGGKDGNGNWDGGHDHTGICTAVNGSSISTIEANTGNGQVLRRERPFSQVHGYILPAYDGGTSGGGSKGGAIEVDGLWGMDTTRLAQTQAGTYVDGYVDDQNPQNKGYLAGCTTGWRWVYPDGADGGSPLIRAVQRRLTALGYDCGGVDGLAGRGFARGLIAWGMAHGSGATVNDGKLDAGGATLKCFQRALNAGTFF